jgi:hypothetical protein
MIILNKFDSALVYLSKGWYDTGITQEGTYEALRTLYKHYYILSFAEDEYIAKHLFDLTFDTLQLFEKEYHRTQFLNGIAPGGKYGCWDWDAIPDMPEYVSKKEMISFMWKQHWKNIINTCLGILSTLKIYDTDIKDNLVPLIILEEIDYSILPKKNI